MSILAARDLAKRYQSRTVVDGVSVTVQSNEIVGLLGPNGAGKTTSFYMILGMIPIDKGSIHLDHRDLTNYPMHARARMGLGYLPQEPSIFRKLSVADNILAILETRPELDETQRQRRLETLLGELNVEHIRNQSGSNLSGGERRRVEIARALASEPRFILFDEPFAGVDPISILDIQRIIQHLSARGIGVLITDHNVRETLGICTRSYIVSEGRIIAEGRPAEILRNPQVRKVYLGDEFRL
uniref:Lipopolysaccharide export system ATP-binding protein LptB n=2 Tax=unclassified Candidatus Kentrum TaxID=2643149 RepID=A0A451APQ8_9GAMM|nr:MAG: lipopolysaccharide export system ATP-binding protein [Candidatus Kentron sp. LPFa]VFK68041.1 MAG: lipopolysaccharide export system ATP-binding protein [Candidatus Kentron sp. UNK]VFK71915.1 MAG: lipopolysaccharide export system ATP-binding protein [Candidatus Kentron sp. UNK]